MSDQHKTKPPVNFMIPGFSKCGTTTLCSLLRQHPEIFIPKIKEPNFFIWTDYNTRWPNYARLFKDVGEATMLGEGSTFYTAINSEVRSREAILEHYPDIRLIFIARDPIDRLESSFREYHHSGARFGLAPPYEIEEALKRYPNLTGDTLFWSRFNNYARFVPQERIHLLFLEDLKRQPEVELRRCFEFLGVDPEVKIDDTSRRLNSGTSKLYDSRLYRLIRTNGVLGRQLGKFPLHKQDAVARPLGLRRPFTQPIEWTPGALNWILDQFGDEMSLYLEHAGKPKDYWPRLAGIEKRLRKA
jgi:hypothetical protein